MEEFVDRWDHHRHEFVESLGNLGSFGSKLFILSTKPANLLLQSLAFLLSGVRSGPQPPMLFEKGVEPAQEFGAFASQGARARPGYLFCRRPAYRGRQRHQRLLLMANAHKPKRAELTRFR